MQDLCKSISNVIPHDQAISTIIMMLKGTNSDIPPYQPLRFEPALILITVMSSPPRNTLSLHHALTPLYWRLVSLISPAARTSFKSFTFSLSTRAFCSLSTVKGQMRV